MKKLVFVVPQDLDRPTGGNRYDQELLRALLELGTEVDLRAAPGSWPVATTADRRQLADLLGSSVPVLVDGLIACGAPEEVEAAVARGRSVHVLVHMPLALDVGLSHQMASSRNSLEGHALRAASGVLATSRWGAADLGARHGLHHVALALPGSRAAAVAVGSTPPLLRQLAAVSPVKDQLTVVEALARLTDDEWSAELTGALDVDPAYAVRVRAAIDRLGLGGRVRLTGPLGGGALEQAWDSTDILLLPSRAETWGLAVTEALARGIPAVVARGTGAQEALGVGPDGEVAGAVVDPGSARGLARAVHALLGPDRSRARRAALARREELPGWGETALAVSRALS